MERKIFPETKGYKPATRLFSDPGLHSRLGEGEIFTPNPFWHLIQEKVHQ